MSTNSDPFHWADAITPDAPPAEPVEEKSPFPDEAEEARRSAAVARAYEGWVEELESEGAPAPTMTPAGPSEYPQFAYLLDATPEQQDRLTKAVSDELQRDAGGA